MGLTVTQNLPDDGTAYTQGDDVQFDLTFTDSNDNPKDITGWTVWMTVKEEEAAPDTEALVQKEVTSHVDAANGETAVKLSSSETDDLSETHYYDVQVKKDNGNIQTIQKGFITFQEGITDAV